MFCLLWQLDDKIFQIQRVLLTRDIGCRIFFRMDFCHLLINLECFVNNDNIPSLLPAFVKYNPDWSNRVEVLSLTLVDSVMIPRQIFASVSEL